MVSAAFPIIVTSSSTQWCLNANLEALKPQFRNHWVTSRWWLPCLIISRKMMSMFSAVGCIVTLLWVGSMQTSLLSLRTNGNLRRPRCCCRLTFYSSFWQTCWACHIYVYLSLYFKFYSSLLSFFAPTLQLVGYPGAFSSESSTHLTNPQIWNAFTNVILHKHYCLGVHCILFLCL